MFVDATVLWFRWQENGGSVQLSGDGQNQRNPLRHHVNRCISNRNVQSARQLIMKYEQSLIDKTEMR